MKKFSNYEETQVTKDREKIQAGGYIVEIKAAKEVEYSGNNGSFERLEISLDVAEGDFKGYYAEDYRIQQSEDKKWRGVLRQYIPKDDGSEKDEWTKSAFKTMITAIEESNPGFHWDWDETKLKGKKVGCLFRDEEWEYDGKTGFTARPFKFVETQKIKEGKFNVPAKKLLKNKNVNSNLDDGFAPINSDDLPF